MIPPRFGINRSRLLCESVESTLHIGAVPEMKRRAFARLKFTPTFHHSRPGVPMHGILKLTPKMALRPLLAKISIDHFTARAVIVSPIGVRPPP
jgi:hypothetical protein